MSPGGANSWCEDPTLLGVLIAHRCYILRCAGGEWCSYSTAAKLPEVSPLLSPGDSWHRRAVSARPRLASFLAQIPSHRLPSPRLASPRLSFPLSSPPIASPRLVLSCFGSHFGVVLAQFFDLFDDVYKNTRTCDFEQQSTRYACFS